MSVELAIDPGDIAEDFEKNYGKRLDASQLQNIKDAILTTKGPIAAQCEVLQLGIYDYVKIWLISDPKKVFTGGAWGLGGLGGGKDYGSIYSADLENLYKKTARFQITITVVYTSVVFLDKNSAALGTFQGGGWTTTAGIGGGDGIWS